MYNINDLDAKLKEYLDVNKDEVLVKALYDDDNLKLWQVQTNVNSPRAIIRLDSSVEFDELDCTFDAKGGDKFTNRILTPSFLKVNKMYCPADLLNTWKAYDVKVGATKQDSIPFETEILMANAKAIAEKIGTLAWVGESATDKVDGIYTIAEADTEVNKIAKGSDDITTRVQKIWSALTPEVADKMTIVMSITNYKAFIVEMMNANHFHIFEEYAGEYRMRLPYANIDVIGLKALEGKDVIMAVNFDELYYGVDSESDSMDVDLYYDKSERNFKYVCNFVLAFQYAFSEHIWINE